jgi:hypothetical protein
MICTCTYMRGKTLVLIDQYMNCSIYYRDVTYEVLSTTAADLFLFTLVL